MLIKVWLVVSQALCNWETRARHIFCAVIIPRNVSISVLRTRNLSKPSLESESLEEDVSVKSGCPSGSGDDRSPTRIWKHHKPHCATINNSHYNEFQWTTWMVIIGFVLVTVYAYVHVKFHPQRPESVMHMPAAYLDKREEMWVALHLPACELKIVFLLPTVMLIARKALMELKTKRKERLTTIWKTSVTSTCAA